MILRLLAAPLTGPLWVAEQLLAEAERLRGDPRALAASIDELDRARTEGRITAAEHARREAALLDAMAGLAPSPRDETRTDPDRPRRRRRRHGR